MTKELDAKRDRIAARDTSIPKMGATLLWWEQQIYNDISNYGCADVTGGKGTGILIAEDGAGRIFKVEITQVGGPE